MVRVAAGVEEAAWDTLNDWPPVTLMLACRAAPVFACTVKLTGMVPEPLVDDGVIHAAPLVAVHAHPFGALIVNCAVPPCDGKLPEFDESV